MRIIHRGKPINEKVYEKMCYKCKSVIEFSGGEARRRSDQREGDYLEIECPVCGDKITTSI